MIVQNMFLWGFNPFMLMFVFYPCLLIIVIFNKIQNFDNQEFLEYHQYTLDIGCCGIQQTRDNYE